MFLHQPLQNPFGITAFGSSIIRVEPDVVSIKFTVSRLEKQPKDAFRKAREGAKSVRAYLNQAKVDDVNSSRITLAQSFKYSDGEQRFVGYTAKIAFHVLIKDLDRVEEILVGIINEGVNEVDSVDYQTSRLKDIRVQARQRAVAASKEKAEIYCDAAGVKLGKVIHIQDVNPDQLRGREGHVEREPQSDDDEPLKAFNPGSITVGGAVLIAFEIESGLMASENVG
jgi:uncharacterized protein YggE